MTAVTYELLQRYDVPGPRYTSYPTADRFVEAFGQDDYILALQQRKIAAAAKIPLSLYVHIPFCESLCYYCACNKIITKHHDRASAYMRYVERELDLHLKYCGEGQLVSQFHVGGGTPTFLSDEEIKALWAMLRARFTFEATGEYSIEIDPRTVTRERLALLKEVGFNRLSFGVQDFDPHVQKAVHREQPAEQVFDLVAAARALGFKSVNVDLIYGLPKQNPHSFARTLEQIAQLRPDRIALYAYAHLPERFKPQRRILQADLPLASEKIEMLSAAIHSFEDAGYDYIGMDHFALPDDALAVAKRQGRLHRNFQGYSTYPDCDLIALGVSSIGRIADTYSQNAKTLEEYYDLLDHNRLPIVRGLVLTRDDLIRRAVIMSIMCQGEINFESINAAWLIDFNKYFESEIAALTAQQKEGLVEILDDCIKVTSKGWFFVRGVALVFDRYLQADRNRARFSRII